MGKGGEVKMRNIIETSSNPPKKRSCEECGKVTICWQQGTITPITRRLVLEKWLCPECLDEDTQY